MDDNKNEGRGKEALWMTLEIARQVIVQSAFWLVLIVAIILMLAILFGLDSKAG